MVYLNDLHLVDFYAKLLAKYTSPSGSYGIQDTHLSLTSTIHCSAHKVQHVQANAGLDFGSSHQLLRSKGKNIPCLPRLYPTN